ncbi:MAG TPA: hypothetical protein VLF93_02035 [Candidatus Saccharimonadales bacterium]|nr:hypothetical protein [Candidatus Saccharimonadales bacterium]
MNEGINLLEPNKKTTSTEFIKRLQLMRAVVVSLLFIVSVSSIILFILVILSPLPALKKQEQSLQETLALSRNDIVKYDLIKERTTSISKFLANRPKLDEEIGLIESKLTGGTAVTQIKIDTGGTTITVESNSLQDLDNFVNGMIDLVQQKKEFSKATMMDLTSNQNNGKYEMTILLTSL